MNRIHVLEQAVAELIAAGEVVERPASVVKELIENSVDAGATKIIVEIKGGGVGYLRITDNGSGIYQEDIPSAFLRHATSKVKQAQDLNSIVTLGFRGEALSSIAAVSKVEIITKVADSPDGWKYEIQGGVALEIPSPIGATNGTTLIIRDIFYNTPARMKFLKSDITEGNAIAQIIDKCALSNPSISFQFIRDGKTRLQTSGNGDIKAIMSSIYGRDFIGHLQKVDYLYQNRIRIQGYIGTPTLSKTNRTYQNYFINGRYVQTRICSVALEEAFKNKLMTGRFPVCVLYIDLDAAEIDPNVHPAKIEVRFGHEKEIYNAVFFAIKNVLASVEKPLSTSEPTLNENLETEPSECQTTLSRSVLPKEQLKAIEENSLTTPLTFASSESKRHAGYTTPLMHDVSIPLNLTPIQTKNVRSKAISVDIEVEDLPLPIERLDKEELRLIGEIFHTYILLQKGKKELLLVDKHAAHERIKYEELKNNSNSQPRQTLIAPITVKLDRQEYAILLENKPVVEQLGFLLEDFGTGNILVRETPTVLDGVDITALLSEIAANLLQYKKDITPDVLNRLYYSIACKAAIRGGDYSSGDELKQLIKRLEENPQITHCPHGRPVSVIVTRKEIEKMFGRLGA